MVASLLEVLRLHKEELRENQERTQNELRKKLQIGGYRRTATTTATAGRTLHRVTIPATSNST